MQLYAWQPKGPDEQSFFVMAETQEQAKAAIDAKIASLLAKYADPGYIDEDGYYSDFDFAGWGTDYYRLTIANVGEVVMNSNNWTRLTV